MDLKCYFTWEDERYPTLVVIEDGETFGFSYNSQTKEFERVCICAAHISNECICGAIED